jgi:MFS family permease
MADNKVSPGGAVQSSTAATNPAPPNGGYGWVVVAASFVVHFLVLGNIYSFGVLFPVYLDVFNASQGSVAWVGSISAGLMTGLGIYTGSWADEFGNARMVILGGVFVATGFFTASFSTSLWHLYLTQGLIAGIGYSLAFVAGVTVVAQWFTSRRGVAVGIAVAGSGLGQFGLSLVTGNLLSSFKWRTTLRILALIDIVGLTLCALAIRRFTPLSKRSSGDSGMLYFKDRNFVFLYASAVVSTLGLFMPYTHVPKFALLHGINTTGSILILSMMGIASAVGRVGIGYAADVLGKLRMLMVCMSVGGASTLAWMGCTSFAALMVYAVVYGFFAGGVISLYPTVIAELYGVKRIGLVTGVLYTGTAFGNLLAAPIAGFIYDGTHNYYGSIALAGSLMLIATTFVTQVDPSRKFEHPLDAVVEGSLVRLAGDPETGTTPPLTGEYDIVPVESNKLKPGTESST